MKYVIMEAHNKHSLLHSQRVFQIFSNNSPLRILRFCCIVSNQSHTSVRFYNRFTDEGEFFHSKQTGKQNSYLSYCSCLTSTVLVSTATQWCWDCFKHNAFHSHFSTLRTRKENEEHSSLEPTYKQVEPVSHVDTFEEWAEKAWW